MTTTQEIKGKDSNGIEITTVCKEDNNKAWEFSFNTFAPLPLSSELSNKVKKFKF